MRTAYRTAYALLRHELRLLASLLMWVARRTHQTDRGRAFGYASGQGAMMFGFAFVCVIESVTMSVLLRDWPTLHGVVLILDVYTIVFVVGLHAASAVRPHVLNPGSLHVRYAAHIDLRIPVERVASVRRELRMTHQRTEGELDVPVGSKTSLTLELTEPIAHFTFFGRRRDIRVVRLHADDADTLVKEIRLLTQERTAPSPLPGPPG